MSSTVVSRLHDVLHNTPGPRALAFGIVLPLVDALALDKLIASLCDDETACEACGTRLCETCRVGEFGCAHDRLLCDDCALAECGECAADAADDRDLDAAGL